MVTASFSIHNLEFFLLILVRMSTLFAVAPFFNTQGVPARTKVGLSFFISILVAYQIDYYDLDYDNTIQYTFMVAKEAMVGLVMGFSASLCMQIIAFAGHFIDIEIGFSMVQLFDPLTNQESSAFGSLYTYLIMLVMLASNMHYFIINAAVDTFNLIPLGQGVFGVDSVYDNLVIWATDYFMIGFRMILPCFTTSLILNVVLGILAKSAPQMNMFVVGMQLKVVMGLAILTLIVVCIPNMTNMLYETMTTMVDDVVQAMTPTS